LRIILTIAEISSGTFRPEAKIEETAVVNI
jgi:hypothetical protein